MLSTKDNEGCTPRDMAVELKALGAWKRALEEGGFDEEGKKRRGPLSERNTRLAIFALPTLVFGAVFGTLAALPWYTGILLAGAEFFGMHHVRAPSLSPFFSSVECFSFLLGSRFLLSVGR